MEKQNKDKYGYPTTSLTLVEKLARGEDWERFCERYFEPIRNTVAVGFRKTDKSKVNLDEETWKIIGMIKGKIKNYDHEKGRLKCWLYTIIKRDICTSLKKIIRERNVLLSDDAIIKLDKCTSLYKITKKQNVDDKDEEGANPFENFSASTPSDEDLEWIRFLLYSSFTLAGIRRPWSERDKKIHQAIKAKLFLDGKSSDSTDNELAESFGISYDNFRQIRSRYLREAKKQYDEFREDDPAFFKAIETARIPYEKLIDEYLQKDGNVEDLAELREKFKFDRWRIASE